MYEYIFSPVISTNIMLLINDYTNAYTKENMQNRDEVWLKLYKQKSVYFRWFVVTKIFDMFSYTERYLTCKRILWVLHRYETIFCDKHICDILLYWKKLSEYLIWYVYFFNILPVGFSLVLVTCYKEYMSMCIFVCFNIIDYISFSTHDHNCYFLLQSIKHCFPKKIVTFFPEGMIYYAIST